MINSSHRTHWIGIVQKCSFSIAVAAMGFVALFIWFPNDIPSGFWVEDAAGNKGPGDGFFPYLLVSTLLCLCGIQITGVLFKSFTNDPQSVGERGLDSSNFRFLACLSAIVGVGLAAMFWTGEFFVYILNNLNFVHASYRELLDVAPYKYIGYLLGGSIISLSLIVWSERRFRWHSIISVAVVLLALIILFDVLLNNVFLPPNGDI